MRFKELPWIVAALSLAPIASSCLGDASDGGTNRLPAALRGTSNGDPWDGKGGGEAERPWEASANDEASDDSISDESISDDSLSQDDDDSVSDETGVDSVSKDSVSQDSVSEDADDSDDDDNADEDQAVDEN